MFDELLRQPGVRETVELRSEFGFMAFHGGLEAGTEIIATEAAERSGASLYAVVQPPELTWHVPSALVWPEHSDALTRFLGHVEVVIAVHGYGRPALQVRATLDAISALEAEEVSHDHDHDK